MPFDFIEDQELKTKVATEVETLINGVRDELNNDFKVQMDGLKSNRDQLLDEKKKLQEKFKGITDPEEALKAMQLIHSNDEVRLLADGKFEEVIQKRLSTTTQEYEATLAELKTKLENNEISVKKYQTMYQNTIRDMAIRQAATAAKVQPEAIEDVLNRGRVIFSVGEDEVSIEARDAQGKLRKIDDKIMDVGLWIESLKKTSPHYWPMSRGGGLTGSGGDVSDIDNMINEAAERGDTKLFRELRIKKKEMQSKQ